MSFCKHFNLLGSFNCLCRVLQRICCFPWDHLCGFQFLCYNNHGFYVDYQNKKKECWHVPDRSAVCSLNVELVVVLADSTRSFHSVIPEFWLVWWSLGLDLSFLFHQYHCWLCVLLRTVDISVGTTSYPKSSLLCVCFGWNSLWLFVLERS